MDERDKVLTEQMGECWHNPYRGPKGYGDNDRCRTCGIEYSYQNDFSTWEGFGKLWVWSQKQDWFEMFRNNDMMLMHLHKDFSWCDPENFANAVYKFLKMYVVKGD